MSNNEKLTETRYPFHGFYRPFVAEMRHSIFLLMHRSTKIPHCPIT